MKKLLCIFTAAVLLLCGCGEKGYDIDGKYITETAYGMEDFYSEIEIEGNRMELEIEHFDEIVEESKGTFTLSGDKITFDGSNGVLEFRYDKLEKTLYNEDMETTWIIESLFIPSDLPPANDEEPVPEADADDNTAYEEPDPIPENVQGTYVFENEQMSARLVIGTNEYQLNATSEASEPLEVSGPAVYAGTQLLLLEDGTSVPCPLDEENGTIEYSGYTFTKE